MVSSRALGFNALAKAFEGRFVFDRMLGMLAKELAERASLKIVGPRAGNELAPTPGLN
jgi:hypothetical protein